jgi:hypothetical protein
MKKRYLATSLSPWKHRPPLCHLDRSGEISVLMLRLGNVFQQSVA